MLTRKEKEVFDFIKKHIESEDIAPTLPEIGAAVGFSSKGTTSRYVQALIAKGYLRKGAKNTSRNLELIKNIKIIQTDNILEQAAIPIIGTIAAGSPIEAVADTDPQNINEVIPGEECFALKVRGQSMIEEGIYDGDLVICKRASHAVNGDIVVALIDGQDATLKRLYYKEGTVLLCPANSEMSPMEFESSRITIQGILTNLLRVF